MPGCWALCALALVAALVAAPGAAGESFLSNISRNLRSEMAGVMEMATVNYSEPQVNATYVARLQFDMRAMGTLYNSSHLVIDFIANKQAYPEGKSSFKIYMLLVILCSNLTSFLYIIQLIF